MENTINYAELTEKALLKAELEFTTAVWNGKTKFNIPMPAKDLPGFYVSLVIDDTGDVLYRCYLAREIEPHQRLDIIMACNKLNSDLRYLNLSVDDEGDLCAAYDFTVYAADEELITDNIIETFFLCFKITDACALYLLKLLWGKDITEPDDFKLEISQNQEQIN